MIEKVARAMHKSAGIMIPYESLQDSYKQTLLIHAKAAIEAMKEPTEEMINCSDEVHLGL